MTAATQTDAPPRSASGVPIDVAVLAVAWLLLSVASGYRWFGPGRDYVIYAEFYSTLGPGDDFTTHRFEPLFMASAWLFKFVLAADVELFLSALIALALGIKLTLIYRLTRLPFLACLTYLASYYILHDYTQLRQAVAIAFGLLSIDQYVRGRLLPSLIFIVIGALFQSSILVLGLGVLVFNALKLGPLGAAAILFAIVELFSLVSSFAAIDLLTLVNPDFSVHVDDFVNSTPLNVASGPNVAFAAMLLITAPLISLKDRRQTMNLVMCLMAVVVFLTLSEFPTLAQRFRDVFAVFGILLAFSFPPRSFGSIAAAIMMISSLWVLYRADDVLGV